MTKTLHIFFSRCKCAAISVLVLLTANNVFGDYYIQGGASFWPNFEVPKLTKFGLPISRPHESSVVSNVDLWIGAGYTLNDSWNVETLFARLPSTEIFTTFNVFYQGEPIDGAGGTLTVYTEMTLVGVGGVYEYSLGERVSLISKVGIAYVKKDSELDLLSPSFQVPIDPENISDFDEDDLTLDIEDFTFEEEDASTLDMYFAVGVRIPIQDTNASATVTYQFFSTEENTESGLFVGVRWDL